MQDYQFLMKEGKLMKLIRGLTTTFFMLSVLICAPLVKASTVTEALEMLAQLRSQTESAKFTGVNPEQDRAFLLRKVDAARLALDQARFCKAVKDLRDFNDRVEKLDSEAQIEGGPHGVTVHDMHDTFSLATDIINKLIEQGGVTCKQ
jgi:hypothetical protein